MQGYYRRLRHKVHFLKQLFHPDTDGVDSVTPDGATALVIY